MFLAKYWDSFWRVLAIVVCLTLVAFVCTQPQVSNDFWLQAKVGEWIVQHGTIPNTLLFPFTEAREFNFNTHEWLPSVLFFYLIHLFGEGALPITLGVAGVLLFVLVARISTVRARGDLGVGLLCALLAMLLENYRHFLRPELLSLFLFVGLYHCFGLLRVRWRMDIAFIAVLLTILWANTHASFVLAPAMSLLYGCGCGIDDHFGLRRHLRPRGTKGCYFLVLTGILLLVSTINPMGMDLIYFIFHFNRSSVSHDLIIEWFPSFDYRLSHTPALWLSLFTSLCLALLCIRRWRSMPTSDVLLVLFFLALGIKAFRFWVYMGFVASLVIPSALCQDGRNSLPRRGLLQISTLLGTCLLVLACLFGNINGNFPYKSNFKEVFTASMVSFIANSDIKGNVYTSYDLGAELVYRAYPRLMPSIDSRIDSYGDAYFNMHENLLRDSVRMTEFIQKYRVKYMLLTLDDYQLLNSHGSRLTEDWHTVFMDSRAIFLERRH
jgi:hypothetical protein